MAFFKHFQFHMEKFFSPSAIQTFNLEKALLDFDEKEKTKSKKRVKKVHRKAIIQSVKEKIKNIENKENQKLDNVQ